jgi:hypothetical protein
MEKKVLKIQKHLREFGLEETVSKFKLKIREYPHKVLFKYDQIESDMSIEEVRECRGLILERNNWDILCFSFEKFFNEAESSAARIDWSTARILEKLDGCCHESTILMTEDGEKTIQNICDNKYIGRVLSYDVEANSLVYDDIVAHSVKPNFNNWVEIELEDGKTITLTEIHKVWLPEFKCYRMVSELKEGDDFLINK